MRTISFLFGASFLAIAACSDPAEKRIADLGCGAIDGAAQLSARKAPKFILVGEFTETVEGPAAFAELACHVAARTGKDDGPLFVGVIDYFGGVTDAETRMRERLASLVAKGAPITVGLIGEEGREIDRRERSRSEQAWATSIDAKVEAAGASRALLLLPRADAALAHAAAIGERFVGYDPMPLHLPAGQVISLEIAKAFDLESDAPAIRLRAAPLDGFHGELALGALTRPALPEREWTTKPVASRSSASGDLRLSPTGAAPVEPQPVEPQPVEPTPYDPAVDAGEVRALQSILDDLEMIQSIIGTSPTPSGYTDIEFSALRQALREEIVRTRRQLQDAKSGRP